MPRLRAGQLSIASVVPAVHSAPMKKPNRVRMTSTNANDGASATRPSHSEKPRIDSISGNRRPKRSASAPAAKPPASRAINVRVIDPVVARVLTPNSSPISFMTRKKMVKSKASSTQPDQAAVNAYHWRRVGSFHQGISVFAPSSLGSCPPSDAVHLCQLRALDTI